jgi:outer membrane protein
MLRIILVFTLILAGNWTAASQKAQAQQAGGIVVELPQVRNYIALGVGALPDYIGSNEYTFGVAPAGMLKFGNSELYAKLIATQLYVNFLNNSNWNLGPAFNYRFGRKDIDDAVVSRMSDIDDTVEAGAFAGWTWIGTDDPRHRFATSVEFLHDVTDVYGGYVVSASVKYFKPVMRPLTLSVGVSTAYGNSDYMETYFGVNSNNAARSGLPQFSADAGFRDVRFPILAIYSFNEHWHAASGMIYQRLLGDASNSPIVDQRGSNNQFFAGVGIAYAW